MMDYAPWVRIILRYIVGALLIGSPQIGEQLAADPDLVAAGSIALGLLVEGAYVWAKRKGRAT